MNQDLLQRIVTSPLPLLAVSEAQAAEMCGFSARKLWGLRKNGRGPRFVRIDGRIVYRVTELARWLDQAATTGADPASTPPAEGRPR